MGQRSINSKTLKAGAAVLGGTLLAGTVGVGAIWLLNNQLASTKLTSDVLRNHLEADMMHDALRSDVLAALSAGNPAFGIAMDEVKADLVEHVDHFREMIDTNANLTAGTELGIVVSAVKPALDAYIAHANAIVNLAATDPSSALAQLPSFFDDFRKLEDAMAEASDKIDASTTASVASAEAIGFYAQLAMVVSSLLAIGAVLAIMLGARSHVIQPIVDLTRAMDRLASGDTAVEAPHRKRQDEIGRMAGALATFRENAVKRMALEADQRAQEADRAERSRRVEALATGFAGNLASSLTNLREAAHRLMLDATSLEQVCEDANSSAGAAIDATDGATSNVRTIAAAATELSASIHEIATRMMESARSAERAAAEGDAAGATSTQLTDAARGIDEIVSLIGGVAEQTNLLALNATIEAARAGEMGRGFAVVASEVKNLASQTSRATADVSRRIGDIQDITTRSSRQLNQVVEMINEMKQLSLAVATAAEQQSAATNSIAENVNSAANRSDEARSSVAAMSGITAKAREATGSVQSSARSVEDLSDELTRVATEFLTQLRVA